MLKPKYAIYDVKKAQYLKSFIASQAVWSNCPYDAALFDSLASASSQSRLYIDSSRILVARRIFCVSSDRYISNYSISLKPPAGGFEQSAFS